MAQHTQGGWSRNIPPISRYPIIFAGHNTHVAKVITDGIPLEEAEANARLITAAPELLEAAKYLIFAMRDGAVFRRDHAAQRLVDAIAKAESP